MLRYIKGVVPINISGLRERPPPGPPAPPAAVCIFSAVAAWRWLRRVSVNACRVLVKYPSSSWSSRVSIICRRLSLACHRCPRRYRLLVNVGCSVLVYLTSHSLSRVVALATFVVSWQRRVIGWLSLTSSELLVVIGHCRGVPGARHG